MLVRIERDGFVFYFPLASGLIISIVLSLVLSLTLWLVQR
ncbi:MAG TPA: DUF2905 family protein [Burkholderiales bacterium]|nr:DUF2905 family protein [Burkholderiales bacterium]